MGWGREDSNRTLIEGRAIVTDVRVIVALKVVKSLGPSGKT